MRNIFSALLITLLLASPGCGKKTDPMPDTQTVDTTPGQKNIEVAFTCTLQPPIVINASVVPNYESTIASYNPTSPQSTYTYNRTVTASAQNSPGYVTVNMSSPNAPQAKLPDGVRMTAQVSVNGRLLKTITIDGTSAANGTRVEVSQKVQVF